MNTLPQNDLSQNDVESAEVDTLLRDLFRQAGEAPIPRNLAARAIELSNLPQTNEARLVRRIVGVLNLLCLVLLAVVVWSGFHNVASSFDAATTTDTTTTTSSTTTVMEIAGVALLLFLAAGTQWAFRKPNDRSYLLAIKTA